MLLGTLYWACIEQSTGARYLQSKKNGLAFAVEGRAEQSPKFFFRQHVETEEEGLVSCN
jgi:hypothetical protein